MNITPQQRLQPAALPGPIRRLRSRPRGRRAAQGWRRPPLAHRRGHDRPGNCGGRHLRPDALRRPDGVDPPRRRRARRPRPSRQARRDPRDDGPRGRGVDARPRRPAGEQQPEPARRRERLRHRPHPRLQRRRHGRRRPARAVERLRRRPVTDAGGLRPPGLPGRPARVLRLLRRRGRAVRRRRPVPHPGHPQRLGDHVLPPRPLRGGRADRADELGGLPGQRRGAQPGRRVGHVDDRRQRRLAVPRRLVLPVHHDGRPADERDAGDAGLRAQPHERGRRCAPSST